jgi:rhodanese-related sulfurtransferase
MISFVSLIRICRKTLLGGATMLSLVTFVALEAIAQSQSGPALPEALKGIKPAGGACYREDAVSDKATPMLQQHVAPDLGCALAITEAVALQGRQDIVFIDTRLASDFERFRIEGALNLAVAQLQGKTFLRNKSIVLIGSGKAERELYSACADLKAKDFTNVKVLRGGMAAWLAGGQSIAGRIPEPEQLTRLTPAEVWIESRFDANVVLVTRGRAAMQEHLPLSMIIPDESPEAVKAVLERRRKELKNAPLASVVLVAEANTSSEKIQRLRQAISPIPLLIYADLNESFTHYMVTQKAVWAAQARGPKQPRCGL